MSAEDFAAGIRYWIIFARARQLAEEYRAGHDWRQDPTERIVPEVARELRLEPAEVREAVEDAIPFDGWPRW